MRMVVLVRMVVVVDGAVVVPVKATHECSDLR
jgi:hypothetical protein